MSETQGFDPVDRAREDADLQKYIYEDFMRANPGDGPSEKAAAAQAMLDYLESRPEGYTNGVVRNPENGRFANADKYFDAAEDARYQSSMPESDDKKSIMQLIGEWAEAEKISDKTRAADIQDSLLQRVLAEDRLSDDRKQQLLDRAEKTKDALLDKMGKEEAPASEEQKEQDEADEPEEQTEDQPDESQQEEPKGAEADEPEDNWSWLGSDEPIAPGTEEELLEIPEYGQRSRDEADDLDLMFLGEHQAPRSIWGRARNRMRSIRAGSLSAVVAAQSWVGDKIAKGRAWLYETDENGERKVNRRKAAIAAGVGIVAVGIAAYGVYKLGFDSDGPDTTKRPRGGNGNSDKYKDLIPNDGPKNGAGQLPPESLPGAPGMEFDIQPGDKPWNVLERAGTPPGQIMNELDSAARQLQIEQGIPFEWHGSGTSRWIKVGGKSDTQSVIDMLRPYLKK